MYRGSELPIHGSLQAFSLHYEDANGREVMLASRTVVVVMMAMHTARKTVEFYVEACCVYVNVWSLGMSFMCSPCTGLNTSSRDN